MVTSDAKQQAVAHFAVALYSCDCEAMWHVATTSAITDRDVRGLIVTTVEHRYESVNHLPEPIKQLSDNGGGHDARETRAFACYVDLPSRTIPLSSSHFNGIAGALVRTLKRDYVCLNLKPDTRTVIELPGLVAHYNDPHPHRARRYRSPREFIA